MDIVAIILCVLKKWKAALIVSIIGSIFMIFLIPYIPFWWVSGIIYLLTILISAFGLIQSSKVINDTSVYTTHSSDSIEAELTKINQMYLKGLITKDEYEHLRKKTLGI